MQGAMSTATKTSTSSTVYLIRGEDGEEPKMSHQEEDAMERNNATAIVPAPTSCLGKRGGTGS